MSEQVKVRFAPSPTGALHLGSALIALANSVLARRANGTMVLRIDDTDTERSSPQLEDDLLQTLWWLGVTWDEGPVRQSDRRELHLAAADKLLRDGHAFHCFCTEQRLAQLREEQVAAGQPPRYDGRCRALTPELVQRERDAGTPHVLRLRVPMQDDTLVRDLLRGDITIPAGAFGDPVLVRSDGSPGYLLASVADDIALGITHVVRGEDHLVNSAVQSVLFRALEHEPPAFAHIALLRDEHGAKLSKRAPLGTIDELVDEGFLPRTVRRYLFELLGQTAVDLLEDAEQHWYFERMPTGAPRVDESRLRSLGREDMALRPAEELLVGSDVEPTDDLLEFARETAPTSSTVREFTDELRRVLDGPSPKDLADAQRDEPEAAESWLAGLEFIAGQLEESDAAGTDDLLASLKAAAREAGLGMRSLLQPLRVALTGHVHGPAIDLVLRCSGLEAVPVRVHRARVALGDAPVGGGVPPRG